MRSNVTLGQVGYPWRHATWCEYYLSRKYDKSIGGAEVQLASFSALSLFRGLIHGIWVAGKWVVDEALAGWNCISVARDGSVWPLFKQREITANEEEACTLAGLFNLTEFLIKLLFVLSPTPSPLTSLHSVDVTASHWAAYEQFCSFHIKQIQWTEVKWPRGPKE
jgi:hypothetical protein